MTRVGLSKESEDCTERKGVADSLFCLPCGLHERKESVHTCCAVSLVLDIVKVSTTKNRKKEEMVHNIASPNGTYFAEDGSFGSASQIVVIDTSAWTEHDWELIDNASDAERVYVAREIGERHYVEHKK